MTSRRTRGARYPVGSSAGSVDLVTAGIDGIADLWAEGLSFADIAVRSELPVTGGELRKIIFDNSSLCERLNSWREFRGHSLIDKAADLANAAAATRCGSGYRIAIHTVMKLAAHLDPTRYGPTQEIVRTGGNGGPIHIKVDLSLSPADAYERMVSGK